jgi:CTP synthase (UTP-ammonia lyase)
VTSDAGRTGTLRVAVVGDRLAKFTAQDSIEAALRHSGDAAGATIDVEWFATPSLVAGAGERLGHAHAVWCAPGSPYLSMEGALEGIRFAREAGRPFLGTCAGFQHGVIEIARHVLGIEDAHHAEYGPRSSTSTLFIDELLCSLVGEAMSVRLVDRTTRDIYGAREAVEQYYCRFGLDEARLPELLQAGLRVAGVDNADATTRIMRLAGHRFFYLTLFVPQTSSTADRPHPIITAYVEAALRARPRIRGSGSGR